MGSLMELLIELTLQCMELSEFGCGTTRIMMFFRGTPATVTGSFVHVLGMSYIC